MDGMSVADTAPPPPQKSVIGSLLHLSYKILDESCQVWSISGGEDPRYGAHLTQQAAFGAFFLMKV